MPVRLIRCKQILPLLINTVSPSASKEAPVENMKIDRDEKREEANSRHF
jgi:hypothetical protein